jgi:hypothetical protein
MFCVNCGKPCEPQHKFCKHCGQPLTETSDRPRDQVDAAQPTIASEPPIANQTATPQLNSPQLQTPSEYRQLKGLRGWLILVGFGLFLVVFFLPFAIYQDVKLFNDGTVQFLSDASSSVHIPGYSGILRFELIGQTALVGTGVCLIALFFGKSRLFPRYYIVFLIATVIFFALDYGLVMSALATTTGAARKTFDESLSGQGAQIVQSLIASIIWVSYMGKSKRVKATFVN